MTWAGSYRATPAVQDFASASTFAVNKAAGTVAGDLILLWVNGNSSGVANVFACSGFAAQSSPDPMYGQLFVRTADGSETTFVVTATPATAAEIVQATIAGPCSLDALGANSGFVSSANPTATGLTVAGANELLM